MAPIAGPSTPANSETTASTTTAPTQKPPNGATSFVKGLASDLTDLYTTEAPTITVDQAPRAIVMDVAACKTEAGLDFRLHLLDELPVHARIHHAAHQRPAGQTEHQPADGEEDRAQKQAK